MLTRNIKKLKAEIGKLIDADAVTQQVYWQDNKVCFIGCLAHSNNVVYITS